MAFKVPQLPLQPPLTEGSSVGQEVSGARQPETESRLSH